MKIILASSSPRRFELLTAAGLTPEVVKPNCEEVVKIGLKPSEIVESLAEQKGKAVINSINYAKIPVIAADTVVALGNEVIGKPKDRAEARAQSGNHSLIFALWTPESQFCTKGKSLFFQ